MFVVDLNSGVDIDTIVDLNFIGDLNLIIDLHIIIDLEPIVDLGLYCRQRWLRGGVCLPNPCHWKNVRSSSQPLFFRTFFVYLLVFSVHVNVSSPCPCPGMLVRSWRRRG